MLRRFSARIQTRFKIAGGTLGEVSWQVTGIRNDPWVNAHRIKVEEDKPDIHPDLLDALALRPTKLCRTYGIRLLAS